MGAKSERISDIPFVVYILVILVQRDEFVIS